MGKEGVTREGKPSAFEQYDGLIADLKREGHSLRSIGRKIDRSGERVRQILDEHYPNIVVPFLSEEAVAKLFGCSAAVLTRLRQEGVINPKRYGFVFRYSCDDVEKVRLALQRFCRICDSPVPKDRTVYCSEACKLESRKYKHRPERYKEAHNRCVKNWMRRHPEQTRVIQSKAAKKYLERQKAEHFAETKYIVIRENDVLPVGTVFKAIGGNGHWHLNLEDGATIPINCVKIVV